jgi:nitrogen fixation/metabolism regulation signal transduction histidine kinase
MLRRKLLIILFTLTGLLMGLAIAALLALQGLFADLNHISTQASAVADKSSHLTQTISTVEVELHKLRAGQTRHLDVLINTVEMMRDQARDVGEHYVMRDPAIQPVYERTVAKIDEFEQHVGELATAQDPVLASLYTLRSLVVAADLREDILKITRFAHEHVQQEQRMLTQRFRWLVIGMAVGFLFVINISIVLLLRTATLVLRPVGQLVQASRELALEHFDHRVTVGANDEFDELANAYNHLAQQLQDNEQRKLEMIGQVALTLNHELNNAIAIIELQLNLLKRQSGGNAAFEGRLREIHESLQRMAKVVESLKRVRRIVLTDYVAGMKMLDLERSVEDEGLPHPFPMPGG